MSYSDDWSDEQLDKAEKAIKQIYGKAWRDISKDTEEYFAKFEVRDNEMKARLDAGEITEDYYRQWRRNQILRGNRWKAIAAQAADRMGKANEVAAAYVNDRTPGIYSLNHDYECYLMEGDATARNQSISLTVYNEQAVKRLTSGKQQRITPKYKYRTCQPDGSAWKEWNQRKLQQCVASAIIRGATLKDMVNEFKRVLGMDQASAIRNARTSWTSAQQAGRYEAQQEAADMGIEYKRKWICVKDDRTRSSHREMDWQIRGLEEPFVTPGGAGLMYPGDLSGPASEVYNCRCSVCTVDPLEEELPVPKKIRVRDANGNSVVVDDMNYSDWLKWKEEQQEGQNAENTESYQKNGSRKKSAGAAKTQQTAKSTTAKTQRKSGSRTKAENEKLYPATLAGVKRGDPMTFEEADNYRTNPKYKLGNGYSRNCQTCVIAFEARLRGYNVTAGPVSTLNSNIALAYEPNLAWERLDGRGKPTYIYNGNISTGSSLYSFINSTVKQGERYTFEFYWNEQNGGGGHIINLDRDQDGNIRLHDNQVDETDESEWIGRESILEYFKDIQISGKMKRFEYNKGGTQRSVTMYSGPRLLRIDNCAFSEEINGIFEAVDT